ncbi:MAG: DNA/RNA nuclease SfsA [Elainella sp. Prado103]|jgi:sugar fermentation stimulation protein A|nr:DNA/RNA nuclease SfsA [Elainella sp. Prado103]
MSDWFFPYPPLLSGTLIKRYKRFFAEILLDSGETIVAHCPNTGPMTGVYLPGCPVQVSCSHNPNRKLPYTWEMIQLPTPTPIWVGTNTALPNPVIKAALLDKLFPQLGDYQSVRGEVPYGADRKSRIDFLLTAEPRLPIYIEVKNTTWAIGNVAMFPDTVTTRGQKHLRELMQILPQARAVMLYFINRGDCEAFAPGDAADPHYGELLRQAIEQGLEVLPCRFEVTPAGIRYLGLAELKQ